MTKKKQQHYVWSRYLRPWTKEDMVIAIDKSSGKRFRTSPRNIAKQKYFYKIIEFSDEEIKACQSLINESHESVVEIQRTILSLFSMKLDSVKKIFPNHLGFHTNLDLFQVNTLEDLHTQIETLGFALLDCKNYDDLIALRNSDQWHDTLLFIFFQYMRTKKQQEAVNKAFHTNALVRGNEVFKATCPILAFQLAYRFAVNKYTIMTVLEANRDQMFITSDQPSVNMKDKNRDEKNRTIDFELFYPISPLLAIKLFWKKSTKINEYMKLTNQQIDHYNSQLEERCERFIFMHP